MNSGTAEGQKTMTSDKNNRHWWHLSLETCLWAFIEGYHLSIGCSFVYFIQLHDLRCNSGAPSPACDSRSKHAHSS